MNIEELQNEYKKIVVSGKKPVLLTIEQNYNISPEAVKKLEFLAKGIKFNASFNGIIQNIAVYIEDIKEIVALEDL